MRKLAKTCILNFAFLIFNSAIAQDIHFSQYYACPLIMNPATTGVFKGDIRFSASYKDQWRSISNPFKTIFASYDMGLLRNTWSKGFLGLGLTAFSDKAGTANMGTSQVSLSSSYTAFLSNSNSISAGIQLGGVQKSLNYAPLKWGNQFNGQNYDQSIASGESGIQSLYYLDASAGLLWNFQSENFNMNTGAAMAHINKPNVSFYAYEDILYTRLTLHGSMQFFFKHSSWSLYPSWMILKQGKSNEVNTGFFLKYDPLNSTVKDPDFSLYLGCFYRWDDAFIPTVRLDFFKNWAAVISYDVTVSTLASANYAQGGAEISLIFTNHFQKTNNRNKCPAWVN